MDKIDTWGWILLAILAFNLYAMVTGPGIISALFLAGAGYLVWTHFRRYF